ncbi:MAG: hypothetical protein P1V36_14385, partial [Planctomycetota bacterium]|nr:hypothetical protein [Planctomycetota bacterium]
MIDPMPHELHDLLDGRLDDDAAAAVRARIAADATWREAWDELQRIQGWVRAHGPRGVEMEPPPTLRAGIQARIADLQAADDQAPGAVAGNDPTAGAETAAVIAASSAFAEDAGTPRTPRAPGGRPTRLLRILTVCYASAALLVVGFTVAYITVLGNPDAPAGGQDPASIETADGLDAAELAKRRQLDPLAKDDAGALAEAGALREQLERDGVQRDRRAADRGNEPHGGLVAEGVGGPVTRARDSRAASPAKSPAVQPPALEPQGKLDDGLDDGLAVGQGSSGATGRASPPAPLRTGGGFRGPGDGMQPGARTPSDSPAPASAPEADGSPQPRASSGRLGQAGEKKTRPSAPGRGRGAKRKEAGTWAEPDDRLGRLASRLTAGDIVYVIETDQPAAARAELLAVMNRLATPDGLDALDGKDAGRRDAEDKVSERRPGKRAAEEDEDAGPRPAAQPGNGIGLGGGSAPPRVPAPKLGSGAIALQLYRLEAPAVANLRARLASTPGGAAAAA